jgi:hypothetical protein
MPIRVNWMPGRIFEHLENVFIEWIKEVVLVTNFEILGVCHNVIGAGVAQHGEQQPRPPGSGNCRWKLERPEGNQLNIRIADQEVAIDGNPRSRRRVVPFLNIVGGLDRNSPRRMHVAAIEKTRQEDRKKKCGVLSDRSFFHRSGKCCHIVSGAAVRE